MRWKALENPNKIAAKSNELRVVEDEGNGNGRF